MAVRSVVAAILAFVTVAATAAAGEYETHEVAGRSYLLHLPPAAKNTDPLPLVIALHGAGGTAARFAEETQFAAATDAWGMMVAFPEGTPGSRIGRTFNAEICCGEAVARQVDDIGFIGAIIDDVGRHHGLDRSRVYATGMSNGGMLAYLLAAVHPEWFAAVAAVSASIGGTVRSGRTSLIPIPDRPVSVMIIHGTRDPIVLFDGGSSSNLNFPNWKLSVGEALGFWTAADGCKNPPQLRAAGTLRSIAYARCAAGSTVQLWEIEGGGHVWPGDIFPAGASTRSAAAEVIAFFGRARGSENALAP